MTTAHIFVLDVDGRPTLVFEAADFNHARAICMEDALRADLSTLTADGVPVCSAISNLETRPASSAEITAFEHAIKRAHPSDEPAMVFLINLDGVVMVTIDPG
jgi:hypothetical protein